MLDEIEKLYDKLKIISDNFLDYQKRNDLVPVQACLKEIQGFSVWFMQENHLENNETEWKILCEKLIEILQDIVQAIEQQDYVLMHDAITYGMMEYLRIFLPNNVRETK
ncbi:MAG: hypothetical protein U0N42_01040 [Roseburia intestinalis]|uniref:hypothetical protein n=1 Tax=Roseburia sp. TaxID=2049040 RepID=UPI002FBA4C63